MIWDMRLRMEKQKEKSMKISWNKVRILLVGILAVAMLGGCSTDTSVKTYLQALLDASYKNDSTAFVKMKLGTAEDAQALYERGIDTGVSVFCGRIGASDDYKGSSERPTWICSPRCATPSTRRANRATVPILSPCHMRK